MIEQLASQIFSDIQDKIRSLDSASIDGESKLKALISARLKKMNLVTREEFDAQTAVLARTRAQLEAMEEKIKQLENQAPQTD